MKKHFSRIMITHYVKFGLRSFLLLLCLVMYIVNRVLNPNLVLTENLPLMLCFGISWLVILVDMMLRLFPSKLESMGCQKQFKKNHAIPLNKGDIKKSKTSWVSVLLIALAWIGLNGVFAILYYTHVIDQSILMIIGLAYSVCDLICILFFCPFQTWFMKNKCCNTCRIYNWDYAMIVTPLMFIQNIFAWSLVSVAFILLIVWEVRVRFKPQWFAPNTNKNLQCANCQEKLCHHKKQLQGF